jgi:hypothetical protein
MTHLGDRIAALVDGELDHESRDRALAHVAGCDVCRAELESQRAVKELLLRADAPTPPPGTVAALLALGEPGAPLPPRARTMPRGPVVPALPPPGRGPRNRREERPPARPGERLRRRAAVVTAATLSFGGLLLGTAFVAGGSAAEPVVPPVAELSVEHGRTSTAVTVGDPSMGLMTDVVGARPGR